jgi:hypothetical protein
MTERFINPISKYTTDTLKTLPGAKLYFYINSSSTPKVVYADINKATPLGSIVTADSAGNFPVIYLDGTYRVELKNAALATQTGWPLDNIGGVGTTSAFGAWSAITTYSEFDLVTGSNGVRYESLSNGNLNNDPTISPTFWQEVRLSTFWSAANTYGLNDRTQGSDYSIYVSLQASNTNHDPLTQGTWWEKVKDQFVWNNTQTYAINDRAFVGEVRYISLQNSNTNQNPVSVPAYWRIDYATMDLGGLVITNSGTPSNSTDLSNKAYTDAVAAAGSPAVSLVSTSIIIQSLGGF